MPNPDCRLPKIPVTKVGEFALSLPAIVWRSIDPSTIKYLGYWRRRRVRRRSEVGMNKVARLAYVERVGGRCAMKVEDSVFVGYT